MRLDDQHGFSPRRVAGVLAAGGLLVAMGCGARSGAARADDPGVNVGLDGMLEEEAGVSEAAREPEPEAVTSGADPVDLERFIEEQTLALEQALGAQPDGGAEPQDAPEVEPAADVSLAALAGEESDAPDPGAGEAGAEPVAEDPQARVDALYAELDAALGQELQSTSEPFRTAVAMIALAAAQGRDPMESIAPGTPAGDKLSPGERGSAEAVARLLGTLLSPSGSEADGRAEVLEQLAQRLTADIGFRIPRALLCTRVRGFGKYEPFAMTTFLAGRPVRALVYAEVDGFEHRPVDASGLGGLVPEDQWSVELSEELQLFHVADARLAWRRPAEKIVETSRNQQRDFYLLAEVELPRTLTVGSYELKVVITDDVSGAVAEHSIPIGIVADPALAWRP